MIDNENLTLEEGVSLLSSDNQPGEHSEQPEYRDSEHAEAEKPDADEQEEGDDEDERAEAQEEEPGDDRPEWDKDDDEADEDKAEDGGRYASPKAKVKLPDGSEARVADLIENGLRHADYTRKAQDVAQARHQYEQQFAGLQQLHQHLEQQHEFVLQFAQERLPQPPTAQDWREDPVGSGQRKAEHDEAIQELQRLQYHLDEQRQTMFAQEQQAVLQSQQERQTYELYALYQAMPQLRDGKKANAFSSDVTDGLSHFYGYRPEELATIVDHRNILVAADALRYRRMMANRTEAQKSATAKKPRTTAPITRSGKRLSGDEARSQSVSRIEERLGRKNSLSMDEAADLLMARKRR